MSEDYGYARVELRRQTMDTMNIITCDIIGKPYKNLLQYVIIGLICVAIGALVDLFLAEDEIGRIHARFRRWAKRLRETPLREWQVKIARRGTDFVSKLPVIFEHKTTRYFLDPLSNLIERILPSETLISAILRLILTIVCLFVLLLSIPVIYFSSHIWILGPITFSFITFLCVMVLIIAYVSLAESSGFDTDYTTDSKSKVAILSLFSSSFLSAVLSLLAILTARYLLPNSLWNTHWFVMAGNSIVPKYPLILPIINFPFDFATVFVTILLLKYIAKKQRYIWLVALIDIAISAALTILLHCFLRVIENGWDIGNIHVHFVAVVRWFYDTLRLFLAWITNRPSGVDISTMRDIHLLPTVVTQDHSKPCN